MSRHRRSHHLVCYDIRQPRRLRRVHRCMLGWGTPLQYSVFHCLLNGADKQRLTDELNALIDPREDDIRIYALRSPAAIEFLGPPPAPPLLFFSNLTLVNAPVSSHSTQMKKTSK
jgi:CRISPR-associated protein Cas2